jgi:TusA-related sulfurtransferase
MSNTNPLKNAGPEAQPDAQIDLRGTPCPLNFVRAKLRLEQMAPGSLLEVWLDPGEPIEQVEDRAEFFALRVRRPTVST